MVLAGLLSRRASRDQRMKKSCGVMYMRVMGGSLVTYSLRSELIVSDMDVFRTKICLHTPISATSNFERRE